MIGYIYKIKNTLNDKVYIGQTIHIKKRFLAHIKGHKSYINSSITKYGKDNFTFEIKYLVD